MRTTYEIVIAGSKEKGHGSFLQHNSQLVDPLNPHTIDIGRAAKLVKSQKTPEAHENLAKAEFAGGLYHDGEQVYVPEEMLHAVIKSGARVSKKGKQIEAGLQVLGDAPLIYDGPKTVDALFADKRFVSRKIVKVGQAKVVRTRPKFDDWSVLFHVSVDTEQVSKDDLRAALEDAGAFKGMGDWRPQNGRFDLVSIKAA